LDRRTGTNEEIVFLPTNYGVTFPMMDKVSVKGGDMRNVSILEKSKMD
jgi:glutathione peroxidase